MPITSELENTRRLKAVGFTDEQAETLAEVIEGAQKQGFERFAEVLERGLGEIRHEMAEMELRLEAKLSTMEGKVESVRSELHSSLRDQFAKVVMIIIGALGVAVALIKLLPDWRWLP
jgi:hypothetical protein